MANSKILTKEYGKLVRTIDSFSAGQAKLCDNDCDNLQQIAVEIKPSEGPYKGGTFKFRFILTDTYPVTPPTVICDTKIFHPNINTFAEDHWQYNSQEIPPVEEDSNVCLSLFHDDKWLPEFGIEDAIQGLLFLFYEPNLHDPLSPYFESDETFGIFEDAIKKSLLGLLTVNGQTFEFNYDGDDMEELLAKYCSGKESFDAENDEILLPTPTLESLLTETIPVHQLYSDIQNSSILPLPLSPSIDDTSDIAIGPPVPSVQHLGNLPIVNPSPTDDSKHTNNVTFPHPFSNGGIISDTDVPKYLEDSHHPSTVTIPQCMPGPFNGAENLFIPPTSPQSLSKENDHHTNLPISSAQASIERRSSKLGRQISQCNSPGTSTRQADKPGARFCWIKHLGKFILQVHQLFSCTAGFSR